MGSHPAARVGLTLALWLLAAVSHGGEVHLAVATNFKPAAEQLAAEFEAQSGHRVVVSAGSSGKLFAQIVNGAPFDLFLSADRVRPAQLVERGLASETSRRIYAIGRLALWSPDRDVDAETLAGGDYRRLALAHPELAPYGAAARESLKALDLNPDRVFGENVGQAMAMAATGNAELALIAWSQAKTAEGSFWLLPAELHAPIEQELVQTRRGAENPVVSAWLDFLFAESGRRLVAEAGYEVP